MNCKEALPFIHEYVDGDLEANHIKALQSHLQGCSSCKALLRSYEKTEAFVRLLERDRPHMPANLTASIMASLPPVQKDRSWVTWLRRHPAMTAAAAFLVIMISSFLSMWNQGSQLTVRGNDLDGIIIEGQRVIVPSEETLNGDLIVEKGIVQLDGDVLGDIVVIDGSVAMASTAHISGKITEVDRALDWIWFKLEEWLGAVMPEGQILPQP